jgi:hypothetical protein
MKINKVTFNNPISGFSDFSPSDINLYPSGPGVYIYGLRRLIDNKLVFIPLYVGIALDLQKRLWQHYCEERTDGNSKWYVFDYTSLSTINSIQKLYEDMKQADSYRGINLKRFSENLIWFNHKDFFNSKLDTNNSNYISNSGVLSSILSNGDLDKIKLPSSTILKNKIIDSKHQFDDNFYFVYSSLSNNVEFEDKSVKLDSNNYLNGRKNGIGKSIAESIEVATKSKLKTINIYTSAKAHGKILPMQIDLTCIKDNLINLTDQQDFPEKLIL